MPKKRKQYPSQYRRQIVDLVRSGRSAEAVAGEFEPSAATVRNWVRQADVDEGRRSDGTTTRDREELGRLKRENKRLALRVHVRENWEASRRTYGRPRIHADLEAQGRAGSAQADRPPHAGERDRGREPAASQGGHHGAGRRRSPGTRPGGPLWVADITCVRTGAGWLYVAVVVDAWSRRVVGWATETHLRAELVEQALAMAVERRGPETVIHHSDQGTQYTSWAFGQRCEEAGVRPSMGSVGDAYDNAMCESFFATLECELLDRCTFADPAEARRAGFDFVEGFYKPASASLGAGLLLAGRVRAQACGVAGP